MSPRVIPLKRALENGLLKWPWQALHQQAPHPKLRPQSSLCSWLFSVWSVVWLAEPCQWARCMVDFPCCRNSQSLYILIGIVPLWEPSIWWDFSSVCWGLIPRAFFEHSLSIGQERLCGLMISALLLKVLFLPPPHPQLLSLDPTKVTRLTAAGPEGELQLLLLVSRVAFVH